MLRAGALDMTNGQSKRGSPLERAAGTVGVWNRRRPTDFVLSQVRGVYGPACVQTSHEVWTRVHMALKSLHKPHHGNSRWCPCENLILADYADKELKSAHGLGTVDRRPGSVPCSNESKQENCRFRSCMGSRRKWSETCLLITGKGSSSSLAQRMRI